MRNYYGLLIGVILAVLLSAPVAAATVINGELSNLTPNAGDDVKVVTYVDNQHERLTDYSNGYSLLVPAGLTLDASLSPIVTVLTNDTLQIEIFYDNFAGTQATANDYMRYSNKFVKTNRDHSMLLDETYWQNEFTIHILNWKRPRLQRVANDKNYYSSIEIAKSQEEVFTILIKSSQPILNGKEIAGNFSLLQRQGLARFNRAATPDHTPRNPETQAFYDKFFGVASPLRWGIFEPSAPQDFEKLTVLETQLNYTFPILVRYQSFDENLPILALESAYERGRAVELTLQTGLYFTDNSSIIYHILDGKYDDYFTQYAKQLKNFGHPVLFRLNNEMNGDWCWYSAAYYSKDTDLYKAVWRHIRTIFDDNGVDNVIWVWNPHDLSFPNFKWNHYLRYYPGDEYVDVIGLTGYNTGTYFIGEKWREFADIYPNTYAEYDLHFAKPFMITEFGSNSVGGNKPAWLVRMFEQISQFNKIKIAIWWNGIDYDAAGKPGRIYILDETDETTGAFRQGLTKFSSE